MSFDEFVKQNMLNNTSIYCDKEYSRFFTYPGFVTLNCTLDEFKSNNYAGNYLHLSYSHELHHCKQLMGSTIGIFEHLIANECIKLIYLLLKDNNREHSIQILPAVEDLMKLRCLYGAESNRVFKNRFYMPKIGDFIDPYLFFIMGLFEKGILQINNHESKLYDLYRKLLLKRYQPIDYTIQFTSDKHPLPSNMSLNHYYIPSKKIAYISARSIIEGYARIVELFDTLPGTNMSKKFGELIKQKLRGIYRVSIEAAHFIISRYFETLSNIDNYIEFMDTALLIHELALMPRIFPTLLFAKSELSVYELFIGRRFESVLYFFSDNAITISNLGDYKNNYIEICDKVCDELGWLKHSDALNIIYNSVDKTHLNDYSAKLIKRLIELKIDRKHDKIPFIFATSDSFNSTYYDLDYLKKNVLILVNAMARDSFVREHVFSDNYETTKKLINNIILKTPLSNDLDSFTNSWPFHEFININDLVKTTIKK
jgi:hypothetical protein